MTAKSTRPLYLELDEAIRSAIDALAARNGRSVKAEIQHALARHLAAPPVVTMTTPPMPPASAVVQPEPTPAKRGRGRPRTVNR